MFKYYHNYIIVLIVSKMGSFESAIQKVEDPSETPHAKKQMSVATLNYCGIAHSPFEFYFKDYEKQIGAISKIFKKLVPKYVKNFNEKNYKWEMGKIDKTFKKGRYSNMFDGTVGLFWKSLLDRKEFEEKWEIEFKKNQVSFKFQWKNEEKDTVKLYDFIMYNTLLEYVFGDKPFEELIKNDGQVFINRIAPLYKMSFLDEEAKLKKFMDGFQRLKPDVFFIQEYSTLLLNQLRKSNQYIVTDPKEDSLILINRHSFTKFQDFSQISKEINSEQQKNFRWAESVAFAGADNFIFACVHLSSSTEKNKVQIQNLKKDLLRLKEYLPKYEIVVGGDLNSFLQTDELFGKVFHLYPRYEYEFTTLKKRTYTQAQYHKAELEVKQSKDRIITTNNIRLGSITYFNGDEADSKTYLPSHEHPYDHLLVYSEVER